MAPHERLRWLLYERYGNAAPLFASGVDLARAITGRAGTHVHTRTTASALSQVLNNRRRLSRSLADEILGAARERLAATPPALQERRAGEIEAVLTALIERRAQFVTPQAAFERFQQAVDTANDFVFFSPQLRPSGPVQRTETLLQALARRLHLEKDAHPNPGEFPDVAPPPRVTLCYPSRPAAELVFRDLFYVVTGRDAALPVSEPLTDAEAEAALANLERERQLHILVVPAPTPAVPVLLFNPHQADRTAFVLFYTDGGQISLIQVPDPLVAAWAKDTVWPLERRTVETEPVHWAEVRETVLGLARAVLPPSESG